MCGIAGFVDFNLGSSEEILKKMTTTLSHRGPDGAGMELFEASVAQIGIGHRRLSIIDLSEKAGQPMHHEKNCLCFNGEIYNYLEVKKELESLGHHFKTSSDTEVVLHAYKEWGTLCLDKFIGMFAFVLYDG